MDNGFFQLNDLALYIPPEQIEVRRNSFNNQWQTLRTRSSTKVKSGFSTIDIMVKAYFADDVGAGKRNGFDQLKDLISQLRVTPFCYVDNQYLRNAILGGKQNQNMAMALKQIEIIKDDSTTNILTVNMHFCWFNYLPFSKSFSFKRDIFDPVEVFNPAESNAWKLLYAAEQQRNNYKSIKSLNSETSLSYKEYGLLTVKRLQELSREYQALEKLSTTFREQLKERDTQTLDLETTIRDTLGQELNNEQWALSVARTVFGDTTSFIEGQNALKSISQVLEVINNSISEGTTSDYKFVNSSDWKIVQLNRIGQEVVSVKESPSTTEDNSEKKNFEQSESILLIRERKFDFQTNGLIVNSVSVSFENILAMLPLIGHPYPTYQHIGSIDARISINFATDKEDGLRALSNLYSLIEEQSVKYRLIPSGHRTLVLNNDIVNLCGIRYTLSEKLHSSTLNGSPGSYVGMIQLLDNPLTPETTENFQPGLSFTAQNSWRIALGKVFSDKLKLRSNIFEGEGANAALKALTPRTLIAVTDNAFNWHSYYEYTGDSDNRKFAFRKLCEEYAIGLSELFAGLIELIRSQKNQGRLKKKLYARILKIFTYTDLDVIGIEKLQEDISSFYKSYSDIDTFGADLKSFAAAKESVQSLGRQLNQAREQNANILSSLKDKETQRQVRENAEADLGPEGAETVEIELLDTSIDRIFLTWGKFVYPFLDNILNSDLLSLPEFEGVKDQIVKQTLGATGDCYPDFPLREVVNLLAVKNLDGDTAYSQLVSLFKKTNLGIENVGIQALLNPDFYFFNAQNDLFQDLISYQTLKTAADMIIASQSEMRVVEQDWLLNHHEEKVLGKQRADQIIIDASKTQLAEELKGTSEATDWKSRVDQALAIGFSPIELIGKVGSSIAEAINLGKDIKVNKIQNDVDKPGNEKYSNLRNSDALTLGTPPDVLPIKHTFDIEDCLKPFRQVASYLGLPAEDAAIFVPDATKYPQFIWPVKDSTRRKTFSENQDFGERDPISGRDWHSGIDIVCQSPYQTFGEPVLAVEDGIIVDITKDFVRQNYTYGEVAIKKGKTVPTAASIRDKLVETAVMIKIQHNGGFYSSYTHLQWDDQVQAFAEIFHGKNPTIVPNSDAWKRALTVKKAQQIGRIGSTGPSTGPHLHFELYKGKRPVKSGVDPIKYLTEANDGIIKAEIPLATLDPSDSLLDLSVAQFKKELLNGQGYGMMRAYPTFRLYFIESDAGERKRYSYDDFFSYSAVNEIQIIRSRKIAADLCIIQLTNISGVLSNRRFWDSKSLMSVHKADGTESKELLNDPKAVNTTEENPVASLMLRTGVEVECRLGYSNNPENLSAPFNGIITDISFSENSDLVTIICQTYAVELVQSIQTQAAKMGGKIDGTGRTGQILQTILASPEVTHFGRWEGGKFGINSARSLLNNRHEWSPNPQDDNIWPPQGTTSLGLIDKFIGSTPYVMYLTTYWDVIQEMTLRHPGYIAAAVPYRGKFGPRMTLYFGLPNLLYFARDPDPTEEGRINALKNVVETGQLDDQGQAALNGIKDALKDVDSEVVQEALKQIGGNKELKSQEECFKQIAYQYALNQGYVKPFRSYHLLTSSLHILENSIQVSAHNSFNVATLQYSGKEGPVANAKTSSLEFGDETDPMTVQADDSLLDEEKRELFAQYPNCYGYDMAKNYCVSLLFNSLKDSYKGSVVIVGNGEVKPFDIAYIADEYSDMYGPIEVEQVVHRFSQKTGFVTEITPDLCVHVNELATLSTTDAMGLIAEGAMKEIGLESVTTMYNAADKAGDAGIGPLGITNVVGNLFSPIGQMLFGRTNATLGQNGPGSVSSFVGAFIFRKQITRTQLAHPFRFSPLVMGGRPMLADLPNRKSGGLIQDLISGKWQKDFGENVPTYLEDLYQSMLPNNWLNLSNTNLTEFFMGEGTKKP